MKEEARHWFAQAQEELVAAQDMFNTGHYRHTIFLCHLAAEKALKAAVVEYADLFPPRTHDLTRLAADAKLEMAPEMMAFVAQLSDEGIASRYPEDLAHYTLKIAQHYLSESIAFLSWLRQKLTSGA